MSKILENVPIQMKCAQDKKLELYSKIICAYKSINRKYIPHIPDIAQKWTYGSPF